MSKYWIFVVLCGVPAGLALSSCVVQLPPYSIYSRGYKGKDFVLFKNSAQVESWNVVIPKAETPKQLNEYRYVYGAVVKRLKKEGSEKTHKVMVKGVVKWERRKRFELKIQENKDPSADINVYITWSKYGDLSLTTLNAQQEVLTESQGKTDCFKMSLKLQGKKSSDDIYEIHSNGCPGIFDPRPMTAMLSEIWIDEMIPKDSANVWWVHPRGNAPDSSLSTFVTDSDVDKFLGFETTNN